MIEKIEIKNFKIFKSLSLNNLNQITLISGKNNIGKSTLLEALFFTNCYFSAESLVSINNIRGALNVLKTDVWKSFINMYSSDNSFQIKKMQNGKIIDIIVKFYDNRNAVAHNLSGITNIVEAQADEKSNDNRYLTHRLSISATDGEFSDNIEYDVKFDGQIEPKDNFPSNPLRMCTYTQYISSKTINNQVSLAEMISRLDIEEKSNYVVNALNILDPNIKEIKTFVKNGIIKLYAIMKNGKSLPIDYMGDGICKLVSICTSILSNPNGLILIDEMENGFHYSMHKKIWEAIYKAAKISNVQVIATTHSYECIKGASDAMDKSPDFGYIRLDNISDSIVAKEVNSLQLKTAVNSDIEVR